MKHFFKSRLVAGIIAATALSLIIAVPVAWSLTVTPGGVVHIGDEAISTLVADQGTLVATESVYSLNHMLATLQPTVIDPAVAAAQSLTLDPVTGTLVPGVQRGANTLNYVVELTPYPTVIPYVDDPNNIGVDFTLPNHGSVHVLNAKDAAMIIQTAATDTGGNIASRAPAAIGIIQTSVGNYLVIAQADADHVAAVSQAAVTAIQTGSWNNTQAETCVAAEQGGHKVIIAVPNGTIGGWQNSEPYNSCPATPVTGP